jgi:deoxyribonuclease-4
VNVHIGSHRGDGVGAGTTRFADGVAAVLSRVDAADSAGAMGAADAAGAGAAAAGVAGVGAGGPPAMLVLENSAGSGWGLGVDVDEIAGLADAIAQRGIGDERVGFCLDTAHAWGAGIDVGSPGAFDDFLGAFDARIGLRRLVMVHLNDSRSEFGSRLYRHEHLGAGRIGAAGLGHVLRHPSLAHVTYFLETPGMDRGYDAINLERARAMALGQPVDDLPAEAFDLPGSARERTAPA